MTDDAYNPKLINKLVFGEEDDTPSDEEQDDTQDEDILVGVDEYAGAGRQQAVKEDLEYEEDCNESEKNSINKGVKQKSAYVHLFESMLAVVLNNESYLFTEPELACLSRYHELSYSAKYILVRLCIRTPGKCFRRSQIDYGDDIDLEVSQVIDELCKSPHLTSTPPDNSKPATQLRAKPSDSRRPSTIPGRENKPIEVIDLTGDDDDDDPGYELLESQNKSQVLEDRGATLDCFCFNERTMTLEELLNCLSAKELKTLVKELRLKPMRLMEENIALLLEHAQKQAVLLSSSSHNNSSSKSRLFKSKNSKDSVSLSSLKQSLLAFGPKRTQESRLRQMVLSLLVRCVKVNPTVFKLLQRVNLVYFRSTELSLKLMNASILSRFRKRFYPIYVHKRTTDIWSSREGLLQYEEALEMQSKVDEFLGYTAVKPVFKTARSASTQQEASSSKSQENAGMKPNHSKLDFQKSGDQEEKEQDFEEPTQEVEENPRVRTMREARAFVFDVVYPKWKDLLATRNAVDSQTIENAGRPRPGLERFDSGNIITRIICKGAHILGTLKEYDQELSVLKELLQQRYWRRARRGKWYERQALILMTHCTKGQETMERARRCVLEGLEDEDTRLVYKFKLQARLIKLEKKLKLPAEEQKSAHFSTSIEKLQMAKEVYIEAIRVWERDSDNAEKDNSTALDEDDVEMIDTGSTLDSWITISKGDSSPVKRESITQAASLMSRQSVGLTSKKEVSSDSRSKSPVKRAQASMSKTVQDKEASWSGKSLWLGKGGANITVEDASLEYYAKSGFKGFHCEGRIISTLFGLLFWDILFHPVAGAFETPYQSAPLDIADETFYHSRKALIDARLADIRAGKAVEIIERYDNWHREKKTWCVGVKWDMFEKDDLVQIAECIGGEPLAVICLAVCEDYSGRAGGVPDLCIWNWETKTCKFVEVKGPGDTLRENQKLWAHILSYAGAHVETCHVRKFGDPHPLMKKLDKRRRSSKRAQTDNKKPLRSKEIIESEDDAENSQNVIVSAAAVSEGEDNSASASNLSPPKCRGVKRKSTDLLLPDR